MPVYEYKCATCNDRFEIEQSFTDDSLTSLEGCEVNDDGLHQLKKVFSAVGISFKGDGFYRNDARGSSNSSTTSGSSSSSTSDSSSNSGDSGSKNSDSGSKASTSSSSDSGSSSSSSPSSSSGAGASKSASSTSS